MGECPLQHPSPKTSPCIAASSRVPIPALGCTRAGFNTSGGLATPEHAPFPSGTSLCASICCRIATANPQAWQRPYLRKVLGYSSPSIGIRDLRVLQVHDALPHVLVEQHRPVVATCGARESREVWGVPGGGRCCSPCLSWGSLGFPSPWTRGYKPSADASTTHLG